MWAEGHLPRGDKGPRGLEKSEEEGEAELQVSSYSFEDESPRQGEESGQAVQGRGRDHANAATFGRVAGLSILGEERRDGKGVARSHRGPSHDIQGEGGG